MSSASGLSCALHTLRLKGHLLQEATETLLKVLYYSLRLTQDSCKRFFYPQCYENLQRELENNIPEPSSQPINVGHDHVKYQITTATGSWLEAKKKVDMCTKSNISSESLNNVQTTSHTVQGIDMIPSPRPMPRRRDAPEIPEPSNPLPGMPVPAFPDVAIPIVPELPLPEEPEFPMPLEPGKAPKTEPLPGEPVTYLPDSQDQKCSTPDTQDPPIDFGLLSNPKNPLGQNKGAKSNLKSCMEDFISTSNCDIICQKYKIPDGLMMPIMISAMLMRNRKNYMPPSEGDGDELFTIDSELTFPQIDYILSILEYQKRARTRIQTLSYCDHVFGMTYEQFKQLYNFISKLHGQVQHPEVLVNRFNNILKKR